MVVTGAAIEPAVRSAAPTPRHPRRSRARRRPGYQSKRRQPDPSGSNLLRTLWIAAGLIVIASCVAAVLLQREMTAMYETFFNLNQRPFGCVPRVDQYYPAASIEAARATLARCLERAEGVGLLVGPAGTGKTLLCQLLAEQFKGEFQVALLGSGRIATRRALLQAILYELGQPYRGMDEGELRLSLAEHLTLERPKCPRGARCCWSTRPTPCRCGCWTKSAP